MAGRPPVLSPRLLLQRPWVSDFDPRSQRKQLHQRTPANANTSERIRSDQIHPTCHLPRFHIIYPPSDPTNSNGSSSSGSGSSGSSSGSGRKESPRSPSDLDSRLSSCLLFLLSPLPFPLPPLSFSCLLLLGSCCYLLALNQLELDSYRPSSPPTSVLCPLPRLVLRLHRAHTAT